MTYGFTGKCSIDFTFCQFSQVDFKIGHVVQKSFHFYARCNQEGSGKSSGVFFNRFLPGEVQSGISVLTADGRYFSGIVGKFSEINLL